MENYTLITGATGGLGKSFVNLFAKKGHNLICTATNEDRLNQLKKEILEKCPNIKVEAIACDLSYEEARCNLFKLIKEKKLNINFLVNNAGFIAEGEFLKHNDDEVLKIIRVNCEGTIDVTQKVIKNRDLSIPLNIITITSLAAYYPMPNMALYAGTKSMLKNFMIALGVELKKENVFITTVCPSGMPTTKAMQDAINSQGLFGKWTACSSDKVAQISFNANKKKKAVVVPKVINRFIKLISKFAGEKFIAKYIGARWKKSQQKRNLN